MLINDLMPTECYKVDSSDYYWKRSGVKKTLQEFEKQIYYTNGDYDKASTLVFKKKIQ